MRLLEKAAAYMRPIGEVRVAVRHCDNLSGEVVTCTVGGNLLYSYSPRYAVHAVIWDGVEYRTSAQIGEPMSYGAAMADLRRIRKANKVKPA